ncbi:hypothetical protein [Neobacillus sp. Marseille-QA0830]
MNPKLKKGMFWGVLAALVVLVTKLLLGSSTAIAAGPHGHGSGGMGIRGEALPQHMMNGYHNGGFPWFALLIGLAIVVLIVRWLRKKAKQGSMQQFIDTFIMSSHTPVINQNANILDQWEQKIISKKENE